MIPVGPPGGAQSLILLNMDADGRITEHNVLPVAFVPLTRTLR